MWKVTPLISGIPGLASIDNYLELHCPQIWAPTIPRYKTFPPTGSDFPAAMLMWFTKNVTITPCLHTYVLVKYLKANLDSQWGDANDNVAMLVRFPKAMALFEGSWTQWDYGVPSGPIVYGTTGTMVSEYAQELVRISRGHGQNTSITPDPLPKGREDVAKNSYITWKLVRHYIRLST